MRILLNSSYAPSLINFRGPLLRALRAKGHEVHVSAPDIAQDIAANLHALGVEVHQTSLRRTGVGILADLYYFRALRRLIASIRAELVIGYTIKPNIWGSLAARSQSVNSVSMVTGLGYAFSEATGLKERLLRNVAQRLYRFATDANRAVIFQNSDDFTDFCAAGCLVDAKKAHIINGSGVDMVHYAPAPLPSEPVFLMIARILGAKGVREYAAAAKILSQRYPSWRFLLVGFLDEGPDGVGPDEVAHWQENGIDFLGRQEDVRPIIATSSIYVLPSYREGTPRSVLEAMAMGRPVVTTDVPGCRETVVDGENGLLVPAGQVTPLAEAMETLGSDAQLRGRMGAAGLALAEEKYAVDKVNGELLNILGL